jgi:hypothetical protein
VRTRVPGWLDHPRLRAAEVRVVPAAVAIVATLVG